MLGVESQYILGLKPASKKTDKDVSAEDKNIKKREKKAARK